MFVEELSRCSGRCRRGYRRSAVVFWRSWDIVGWRNRRAIFADRGDCFAGGVCRQSGIGINDFRKEIYGVVVCLNFFEDGDIFNYYGMHSFRCWDCREYGYDSVW